MLFRSSTPEKSYRHFVHPTTWPAAPSDMSVTACAQIEQCPRRWALSTADYPDVWNGRGYPPALQVATLAGSVVHLAIEIILKRITRAGLSSVSDPAAPQVLRELGGFTRLVEDCVGRILGRYVDNPRAGAQMEHARRTLRGQVPQMRVRVQSMLSRLRLPNAPSAVAAATSPPDGPPRRLPLKNGIHPEVEVRAQSIRWKGKLDLLAVGPDSCTITDFKTGMPDEAHKVQVRAYAVMWRLDDELNPSGRLADRLVLAYEGQDVDVSPPGAPEIEDLSRDMVARRQAAEGALATRPPPARPDIETCRYCNVRQLCDAYWASANPFVSDDGRFGDVELRIVRRHGPTSWDAVVLRARDLPEKAPALLRLPDHGELAKGAKVRVLNGALVRDPEDNTVHVVVTVGVLSEVFHESPDDHRELSMH